MWAIARPVQHEFEAFGSESAVDIESTVTHINFH